MDNIVNLLILLVNNAVPILTALGVLVVAIRGESRAAAIGKVQDSANQASIKAEVAVAKAQETHDIINSRVDQLIAEIQKEAARAIEEAKLAARAKIAEYREEASRLPATGRETLP